jgi:GAF domain-containing protein
VNAATVLFGVDGAGLMLVDPDGRLRWAVASDPVAQLAEDNQEVIAQGPCQVAFAQGRPVHLRDAGTEHAWGEIVLLYVDAGVRAALSVPIVLAGGPVGTLDLFSRDPRDWHATNLAAVRAYAGVVAGLLGVPPAPRSVACRPASGPSSARSSRQVERRCHEHIAFRALAGNGTPRRLSRAG